MYKHIDHAADHALKSIKLQLIKSAVVLGLLIFIAVKQHDFLFRAVASHPELNLLIIGVFIFGLIMAVRSNLSLIHDDRALRWMKETFSDFQMIETMSGDHYLTRLLRVAKSAAVFQFPKIIGQVYELASEELLQKRTFHVSLAQRNSMMGMVQESIHREKSLVHYITGVMILLGLIGTFIGLMEMVASVGGIVGGLAKAGSGSDEAIKGVIKDLEAPLTGMATGFSASLFGLLGSLVLGLIARFGQTATLVIKHDLEHWLTRISQLEAPSGHFAIGAQNDNAGGSVSALAMSLVGSFRTIQGILVRSSDVMRKLADRQDNQTEAIMRLLSSVDALSVRHEQALWQLRRVDAIGDSVEALRSDVILNHKSLENRVALEFGRVTDVLDQAEERHAVRYGDIVEQHRVTERLARSLELQAVRGFEDLGLKASSLITEQSEMRRLIGENQDIMIDHIRNRTKPIDIAGVADRLGAAVDERLAAGFGAIAGSLDKSLSQLSESLAHFGDAQSGALKRLDLITAHPLADEMRNLSKSIESGLATGFADLSRILDVMMASQAMTMGQSAGGQMSDADMQSLDTMVNGQAGSPPPSEPPEYAAAFQTLRSKFANSNFK